MTKRLGGWSAEIGAIDYKFRRNSITREERRRASKMHQICIDEWRHAAWIMWVSWEWRGGEGEKWHVVQWDLQTTSRQNPAGYLLTVKRRNGGLVGFTKRTLWYWVQNCSTSRALKTDLIRAFMQPTFQHAPRTSLTRKLWYRKGDRAMRRQK